MTIDALNQRFGSERVQFAAGQGQLTCIRITHPAATAELYLQGAHLTHFQPAGQKPVLFMSSKSIFETGKAIRGGIPICFPWFGPKSDDPTAPAHGFARTSLWTLQRVEETDESVVLSLWLSSNDQTLFLWPNLFRAELIVRIGKELSLTLKVENTGNDAITFEEALHTYFVISDIHRVQVEGLQLSKYLDKTEGLREKTQTGELIRFDSETDRVYLNTTSTCTIHDSGLSRKLIVSKTGSNNTVVWNPFAGRASQMRDVGPENWEGFVCVETANCSRTPTVISPGQISEMTLGISIA